MAAAPVKKSLRHGLFINTLNRPPNSRESDHIRGHVFQGNPRIAGNGSESVSTALSPKTFNHVGITPTSDVRLGKLRPRRSDIRRLHPSVVVDEGRDIIQQNPWVLSHETRQVMDEVWEDVISRDGVLLEVGGTKVDR